MFHSQLTDTSLLVVNAKPSTAPTIAGQAIVQVSADRTTVWIATGISSANDWRAVSGTPIRGTGAPTGVVVPDYVSQEYIDTATNFKWVATTLLSSGWAQVGGGGGAGPAGAMICTSGCAIGGKGFSFPTAGTYYFNITIVTGAYTGTGVEIEINQWTQEPNTPLVGKSRLRLMNAPGTFVWTSGTHKWLTFAARNPAKSNQWDGLCATYSATNGTFYLGAFS